MKPCLGHDVLESYIKSCKSPSILHLATHGFFLPNQSEVSEYDPELEAGGVLIGEVGHILPTRKLDSKKQVGNIETLQNRLSAKNLENPMLRSGLALAGANTWLNHCSLPSDAEDGILTAEDVSGIDLSSTELVVLSASETGLGDIFNGEGVFGLQRAFMRPDACYEFMENTR